MTELPSGMVTFLFTDLEGSTRLWEQHPDAMKRALARHDAILRAAVESCNGFVVKTTGDGLHAVFVTAPHATTASVVAQRQLLAESWALPGSLKVRMGLHSGVAELREGDYYGSAVNRAARLMSVAHGAQIVCSQAVADLVCDDLTEGVALVDLGAHRLRDFTRAERVFQIVAPGLPAVFPSLRSVDAFASNLPVQVTSFVGREAEIATITDAFGDARLVTLTGVGGVGKTRLGLQVAADLLPGFPDGVWLCELAAPDDGEAVAQVVAAALGVQERPDAALEVRVRAFLRDQRALLVLDNCEHLLEDVGAFVEGVLRDCPQVRILATSREALAVGGERVVRVPSLPVPGSTADLDALATFDAVRLFVERASAVDPDFVLSSANARAVAQICRRLDGIPLAVELAAASVVGMRPREIADLLDERFRLLTGGRRTSLERHQTLRAMVDWSYSLLNDVDRAVFDRLAVFPASFDTDAALAVAASDGVEGWDVRDALGRLVNKSMIVRVAASHEDAPSRYQLLETLRAYARERLDEQADADYRRRRHARHYTAVAEGYGLALLTSRDLAAAYQNHRAEIDNYRAALTWSFDSPDSDDGDLALRIAAVFARGYQIDRRALAITREASRLLERAESINPKFRSVILAGMAYDTITLEGNPVRAADLARQALADAPPSPDAAWLAQFAAAYYALAYSEVTCDHLDAAREVLLAVQKAGDDAGQPEHDAAFWLTLLTRVEVSAENWDVAREHAEAAVALARTVEWPYRLMQGLCALAAATAHDDPPRAREAIDEACALVRLGVPAALNPFVISARLHAVAGNLHAALEALWDAAEFSRDAALPSSIGTAAVAVVVFTALDIVDSAAVLAGAVTTGPYAPLIKLTCDPVDQRGLDHAVVQLRSQLTDGPFDATIARGAPMSHDDIVDTTLDAVDAALTQGR